jgi:hypothetical protein
MRTILLCPATLFFLAWVIVLIACALLGREGPRRDWPAHFQANLTWKWLEPTPFRLRALRGARGPQAGFGQDLLASYSADLSARFTEALKSVQR